MKNLLFKRRIYFNILKFFGLCSACFVFEACYGAPRNEVEPIIDGFKLYGNIITQDSLKPIPNIKVEIISDELEIHSVYTDSKGFYEKSLSINPATKNCKIKITDVDGAENGIFLSNDSSLILSQDDIKNKTKFCNLEMKKK